tara:strand:- start:740 stop:973 length:234 start_codon:yes stop_codon:yes gene_type:complete
MTNPKVYKIDAEVLGMIWGALHESANEELARVVSDTMITQGCQELTGVDNTELILLFWKNYLEENDLITFTDTKEFH